MIAKLRRKAASIAKKIDLLILTGNLLAPCALSPRTRRSKVLLQFVDALGVRKKSAKIRRILKYICMRYLVRARVKPGREQDLLNAIQGETLGEGSVAEGEYLRNMKDARLCGDDTLRLCRKSVHTGKSILTSQKFRTLTIAANVPTRTDR